MQLSPHVSKALEAFRKSEGPRARGPRFKDVALALEREMIRPGVPEIAILECFGPPDIHRSGLYVYFFDHETAGGTRDEWYFHVRDGKVFNSGFNARGVNNFSKGETQIP
jgi:hypothetical protein